jgi:hypothetical protein
MASSVGHRILTDVHFWIPLGVLIVGMLVLLLIH